MSFIKYIADENHYKEVLSLVGKAKRTVWIGTADIKDLYVNDKPFLAIIASLLKKGVEVRLIHAKEPGTAWPILTGILVGYIANRIMSGEGKGCCKGDYAAVWKYAPMGRRLSI